MDDEVEVGGGEVGVEGDVQVDLAGVHDGEELRDGVLEVQEVHEGEVVEGQGLEHLRPHRPHRPHIALSNPPLHPPSPSFLTQPHSPRCSSLPGWGTCGRCAEAWTPGTCP